MADTKISNLTEDTAPTGGNLFPEVDDTTGTPVTKYIKGRRFVEMGEKNYKVSVTVSSNDLIVALKNLAGNNFSATDPLVVKIGDTWRTVEAALSITIVDGTNWMSAGSPGTGGLATGWFPYLVWDSNSSVVAITIARIPYARLVSDFSATTTNEKHCYNYANFTTTDDVVNIGYFEATLSLVATSYLWTVPTFTGANLVNRPTFSTRPLSWTLGFTGFSANPTTTSAEYVVREDTVRVWYKQNALGTSNATGFTITGLPFSSPAAIIGLIPSGFGANNSANITLPRIDIGANNTLTLYGTTPDNPASWTASGTKGIYAFDASFKLR